MLKLSPVTSALAALIIASALSGCGGGNVEPVSAPTSVGDAQTTTDSAAASAEAAAAAGATAAAEATSAADATKAAAAEAATAAKAASDAKAAADAKAKAAAAAKAKAVAAVPVAKPAPAPAPKPAPAPAPSAKTYANCTAMHVDYKGGVARPGAVDHRTSGHANYAPVYSQSLYDANKGSDRDGDGIACEA